MAGPTGSTIQQANIFIAKHPPLPPDVKKRFPSMIQWEKDMETWTKKLTFQLQNINQP